MAIDYTRLIGRLFPESDEDGSGNLTLRKMTVEASNADGTLDLTTGGGVTIPSVPRVYLGGLAVGAKVQVLVSRGQLLVLGPVSVGHASVSQFNTNNPVSTSTSYTALTGANIHGVAFIAPPSGVVKIEISGWMGSNHTSIQNRVYMSAQVQQGSVVNSGTVVDSPSDEKAIESQNNTINIYDYRYGHISYPVSGLVPGDPYNATTMVKAPAGSIAVNERWILVSEF